MPSIQSISINDAAQDARNLIKEAVSSQIVSDVPFGCLLSGGIDSTTVTHFLDNVMKENGSVEAKSSNCNILHTFSLQLPEYQQHFQVGCKFYFIAKLLIKFYRYSEYGYSTN